MKEQTHTQSAPICLILVRDPFDRRNPDPAYSEAVIDGIRDLALEFGFKPRKIDPRYLGEGAADAETFRMLQRADVVIVDIHAASSDFFYLLGARHALTSRPTLILDRTPEELAFDLRRPRFAEVRGTSPLEVAEQLRPHLQSILDNSWQQGVYSLLRQALEESPRVFLSYAHSDRESVFAVDQWLRDRGARVDIDERDFVAGQDIRGEIVRLISQAGKVVCFYSKASEDRYYTRLERRIVEEREQLLHSSKIWKPLLVYFRLDDTPLPIESSHRLAINAWTQDFETACRELWRHILGQSAEPRRIDLSAYRERAPWSR